jgi:hypothetical protein
MTLSFVIPGIVLAVLLRRAYTEVDEAFVDEWAQAHALTLTERSRPMVGWYLHTARVLRTWGVVAGLVIPPLFGAAFGINGLSNTQLEFVFFGYLVGALYAELALVRPAGGERRVATLSPRELEAYLPQRLLLAQRVLPAVIVLAAALTFLVPYRTGAKPSAGSVHVSMVVVAGLAVILGLGLLALERWLIQRPQPFAAPDLIAADDAIRSQSVHSLAGSGVALLLLGLGATLFALALSDVRVLRATMWAPAVACLFLSIGACLYYGHRAWRVRRGGTVPVTS